MTEVSGQDDNPHTGVISVERPEEPKGSITAAVVDVDDLEVYVLKPQ
jgi:hypothetical protein